ncbi:MAG TPA: glycosyltransferase family 39 protein [Candidatus Acidoferrum sp.]|nr:glycosyltransferase family 39 protein [Candidatus Acidoferrum sp.]
MRGIEPRRSSFNSPADSVWVSLAIAIAWFTICFRLGSLPLLQPDEGRNAEVAREMKVSGAWLVPTYNGVDYLDKPAFYFKAVALSLAAFGDNESAARLPSAVFGLGLLVLSFAFCRRVYGTRCGLLTVIILATTPLFVVHSRTVIFDIALAFFVCGAIFAGYLAEETEGRGRRNWYLLGAASAGFATLVKGPVGFLIPVLVLLIFNRFEGRRGIWKRLLGPLNLLVFFGITLPWFVGLCLAHRDFFQYGLLEESFHRFTTAKTFHRSEPFYFYVLIIALTFFPWSVLLPEAAWTTWRERGTKGHRADRLCLLWTVIVVVFFSISQSKLPGYILSVTVAVGILVARRFERAFADPAGQAGRAVGRGTLIFAVLCLLLGLAALAGMSQTRQLAGFLRIPVADAERLGPVGVPLAIAFVVFGVLGLVVQYARRPQLCLLCLAVFIPVSTNAAIGMIDVLFNARSGRAVASRLATLPADTNLACLECFPNGVPFYLRRTITLVSRTGGELTSNYILSVLKRDQPWPEQIVPVANFDSWLASRKTPIYLIAHGAKRKQLESIAAARGVTVEALPADYWGALLPAPGGS